MNKKVITLLLGCLLALGLTSDNEFRKGWYDGYPDGYRDICQKVVWVPRAPYPPNPSPDRQSYKDGYANGFKRGQTDARKRCPN